MLKDMREIINRHQGHYFSQSTMRFFRSRLPQVAYEGPGGIYFVTSEQLEGSDHVRAPRRYTVRRYHPETDQIDTVGEFNTLSRSGANRLAKQYAERGVPRTGGKIKE